MKTFILFFLGFFINYLLNSQNIILFEDFESTSNGYLPTGWTKIQENNADGWITGNNLSSNYFVVPAHSVYVASNDDACNCNSLRNMLITPVLDFSGYSKVLLSFDRFFTCRYGDDVSIEVSVDGGQSWTIVKTLSPNEDWTKEYVDLSQFVGNNNVLIAFCYTDNGYWASGCAIDNVKIIEPTNSNYIFYSNRFYPYVCANDSFKAVFSFVNLSVDNVNSISVEYYLSDTNIFSENFSGFSLSLLDTFKFDQSFFLDSPGIYNFKAIISEVNGSNGFYCDTVLFNVYVLNNCYHSNVLLEENTATWCGFCPEGDYFLDSLTNFFYGRVFPVSVHYGDVLSFDNGNSLINSYFYTFPSLMINRWKFDDEPYVFVTNRYEWFDLVEAQLNNVSPFKIILDGDFDYNNRIFTLHAFYIANGELNGDFSVNLYVVEKGIDASGNANLSQVNSYNNIPSSHFYMQGDTLTEYYHKYVLRYLSGGVWGYSGFIPDTMHFGDTVYANFVVDAPLSWNENNLLFYTIVEKVGENSIYDRNIVAVESIKVIDNIVQNKIYNKIRIYPNPARNMLYVKTLKKIKTAIAYNVEGTAYNLVVKNNVIDISQLTFGFYILKAKTFNNEILIGKFVKR